MITKPTAIEKDLLTHLIEESSEVIKEACKIQRYGFDSAHPLEPQLLNKQRLENEIADVLAVVEILNGLGVIDTQRIEEIKSHSVEKKLAVIRPTY